MNLNLGFKIKELRRRDERTQEALAEALGVTAQAVSRWESGGSYPDMELIPSIANYFHVSIDELFGYHADREKKIKEILDTADKILEQNGRLLFQGSLSEKAEECINMLRAASEEFPNEPKILSRLAKALHSWGYHKFGARTLSEASCSQIEFDTEYNSQNIYWQEALTVFEKLLKLNPSAEDRDSAVCQMVTLYCRMGKYEKAKALANAQNSLMCCNENLMPMATTGEERTRYQGERIMALLSYFRLAVFESVSLNPTVFTSEYRSRIITSIINLYDTVFDDGKYGVYHYDVSHLYFTLADYEVRYDNELQNALAHFDKGFEHYKKYEQIREQGEYIYSAPLVSKLKSLTKENIPPLGENFLKHQMQSFPECLLSELRKSEKYTECFV